MITPKEIDAIRKRVEDATPGPWEIHISGSSVGYTPFIAISRGVHSRLSMGATQADKDFMANARTDIPKLLAEIDRLNVLVRLFQASSEVQLQREDSYDDR